MTCLHIFDMDGTLLVGSACLEISRSFGVLDETIAIEETWARGEISDYGFWEQCLPLWDGITDEQIDRAFEESPWLDGIDKVFADIQTRKENSIVISQSPKFFVERIQRWGLNHAHGALVTPGNSAGAEQIVTKEDKLKITKSLMSKLNLSFDNCVAYGDSSSDLELFKTLSNTVAINANETIRELAQVSYEGSSIWDGYSLGRSLLDKQIK
jgi:phosphoserine phosphatase